jgi:hypothetical protein
VYATNKTGSSSDDRIYYELVTHSLVITSRCSLYSAVSHLHNLQSTVAHALGFSLSSSRSPNNGSRRTNYNSLALQIFHVNLLFTEAVFSTRADNSSITDFGFRCQFSLHRLLHTHHLSSGADNNRPISGRGKSGLSLTSPQQTNKLIILNFLLLAPRHTYNSELSLGHVQVTTLSHCGRGKHNSRPVC